MPVAPTQPVYPPSAGYPVEAIWGDAVSDRTVQPFTSIADRDAKWTAPPDGAVSTTLDQRILWYRIPGAWVALWGSPAEVGQRDDVPNANEARFGHVGQHGAVGFIATPSGTNYAIAANGQALNLYERDVGGSGFNLYGTLAQTRSRLNDIGIGWHPAYSYRGLWMAEYPGGSSYMLLFNATDTVLNSGGLTRLAVAGADKLRIDNSGTYISNPLFADQAYFNSQVQCRYGFTGYEWYRSQLTAQPLDNHPTAHIALLGGGSVAPQIYANSGIGEVLIVQNGTGNAYAPVYASAFSVQSSLATKRDVRTLRPNRIFAGWSHDSKTDRVPLTPDIMALRPVAFRPKVPALHIVARGDKPVDLDDPSTHTMEPRDPTTWLGHEGVRERLGLVADEVQHVIPSAVAHDEDGNPVGIDYAQIVVALLDHVQHLTEEVATLRSLLASTNGSNGHREVTLEDA